MITKKLKEPQFGSTSESSFVTTELSLTAALVTWGFPVDFIDRTDASRVAFYFKRSKELDNAVQAFWANTARTSPKDYFQILRELKSRIREGSV